MTDILRVALIDDDAFLLDAMSTLLRSQEDVDLVGTGVNGLEAVQLAIRHKPDVMLLDVDMPAVDGIEAARQINERFPKIVVIMLTAFEQRESLGRSLAAGAKGFLTKDVPIDHIVQQMHRAVRGETVMAPRPVKILVDSYTQQAQHRESDQRFIEAADALSDRLADVLELVITAASNRKIAEALHISEGTARNYVSQVLELTGCATRSEAAVRALRAGYEGPGLK